MKGRIVNKQGIYITLINAFLGIGASLLLKDNATIAWVIFSLVIASIVFIERTWLKTNIFKGNRAYALSAYAALALLFVIGLLFVTEPMRKTTAIVACTTSFLTEIRSKEYERAYARLSAESKLDYSLEGFTKDHIKNNVTIKDFTIEQVTLNKYNNIKALALVTSPFTLYGHETLNMELIKEKKEWKIILSRNIFNSVKPLQPTNVKRKDGVITNIFKSIF